ncbi:GDSL-like Lipase/Acylhydrolase superfamily protein [Dorcoceras hygrometricum]|uniref:GDSL-like Lipase/Acylhydrolase superfamily protein n=1 Tax=Dorcoceras hygrometricum TaxID=472368 RepID=A0A2Z7CJY6_9LAMI|nr:GDSL-like Lipase/Acylhydrolase superfamily protein [Dorcoceras hygrometricum]
MSSLHNYCCIAILSFLLLPRSLHSSCTRPPVIFNFGDSNSDTGGLVAGLGFPVNLPNGRAFFAKSTGRLSDGRLIIDFLCQSLNTSLLSPYLDSLGSNFSNGANFAVAGSCTLPKNVPFALNIQVQQFTHFKARSAELVNAGVNGVLGIESFSDALYIIDIGQNDLADSFSKGLSYVQVFNKIPSVLTEIQVAVKEIYNQGGRKFWVHNTGPLGCLPQKLALVRNDSLDSFGCIASYNEVAQVFNEGLRKLCQELRSDMKDVSVVYVDIYSIKLDIVANSSAYGFSSPLMACCGSGGPPYNYDKRVTCGFPGYQVCDQQSRFVSWDGVHYTEAANALIASKILSSDHSIPKVNFEFFCQ